MAQLTKQLVVSTAVLASLACTSSAVVNFGNVDLRAYGAEYNISDLTHPVIIDIRDQSSLITGEGVSSRDVFFEHLMRYPSDSIYHGMSAMSYFNIFEISPNQDYLRGDLHHRTSALAASNLLPLYVEQAYVSDHVTFYTDNVGTISGRVLRTIGGVMELRFDGQLITAGADQFDWHFDFGKGAHTLELVAASVVTPDNFTGDTLSDLTFEISSPAPVPEPCTLVACSAIVAVCLKRRSRA